MQQFYALSFLSGFVLYMIKGGYSAEYAASVLGIYLVVLRVSRPLFGALVDYIRTPHRIIATHLAAATLCCLALRGTASYIFIGAYGAIISCIFAASKTAMLDWLDERNIQKVDFFAKRAVVSNIATILTAPLTIWIIGVHPSYFSYLVATFVIVSGFQMALFVERDQRTTAGVNNTAYLEESPIEWRKICAYFIGNTVYWAGASATFIVMPTILSSYDGGSAVSAAAISINGLIIVFFQYGFTKYIAKNKCITTRYFVASSILNLAGVSALMFGTSAHYAYAFILLKSISEMLYGPMSETEFADASKNTRKRGFLVAIQAVTIGVGEAFCSWIMVLAPAILMPSSYRSAATIVFFASLVFLGIVSRAFLLKEQEFAHREFRL